MDREKMESELQAKAKGPRVTLDHIKSQVIAEQYHVFPGTTMTVACLTLQNGYQVVGESACADPENFDEKIGRNIARENALNKIWQLEGYLLRAKLSAASN